MMTSRTFPGVCRHAIAALFSMSHIRRWPHLIARLALIGIAPAAWSNQAVILSDAVPALEVGQGFLGQHAGQCHLVMPTHVAAEGGSKLRREGAQPLYGQLQASQDLGDDISLVRVAGIHGNACGLSFSLLPRAVDTPLQRASMVQLRFVNGDGSIGRIPVSVVDNDQTQYLRVKPLLAQERIYKGMSGSQLIVDGAAIGMLLSVHARTGVGTVIRQDALLNKVDRSLRQSRQPDIDTVETSTTAGSMLTLLAWDALPVGQAQPDSLVSDDSAQPWRVTYTGKPVSLDFRVQTPDSAWAGVQIDVRGIAAHERPEMAEILLAMRDDAPSWMAVKTVRLTYEDDVATIPILRRRSALLRVRLSQQRTPAAPAYLGVRRIAVLP